MSAFMCSDRHLTVLAAYAVRHGLSGLVNPREQHPGKLVAECYGLLARENAKSLDSRYPNDKGEPIGKVDEKALFEKHDPIVIIKACHCYAYQSCEHTGWQTSQAKDVIERVEAHAVRALPGYEAAPWGLDR